MRRLPTLLAALLACLAIPAAAHADRVYFATNSSISYAELEGGGGDLNTEGATISSPRGVALDPAAGRIYWANGEGTFKISWASLDGSGGGDLATGSAPVNWPTGVGLDRGANRIYWANYQGPANERIAYASLDGSGGGVLPTGEATIGNPQGVAIDPAAGRIYWSNESGPISYAELDGSGGGDIDTTGAGSGQSEGVAIDPTTQRIYWTRHQIFSPYTANISYAGLTEEGGGHDLATGEATLYFPAGVAIDPEAERVYWANTAAFSGEGSISQAALDGSGGEDLSLTGATTFGTNFPALLKAPEGSGAPVISPQLSARPRALVCNPGSWAGDVPEALLYRAPHATRLEWLRDGQPVAEVTEEPIYVDGAPGTYACRETATNAAGSSAQTSTTVEVCCRHTPEPRALAGRVALVIGGRARLRMRCPETVTCSGRVGLGAWTRRNVHVAIRRATLSRLRDFSIPAGERKVVPVRLLGPTMKRLRRSRKHRMRARLAGRGVQPRTVLLKLSKKRKRRPRR